MDLEDNSISINFTSSNSSNSSDDSILLRSPTSLRITVSCLVIVISILGVVGNSLTIAALVRSPKLRNLTVAFIISLCASDMVCCVAVMPFSAFYFITGKDFAADSPVLCVLQPTLRYCNVGVSLLTIAMITINRCVMITFHEHYARIYTKKSVALMVAFTWIFALTLLIPTLSGKFGRFGYDAMNGSCSIMGSSTAKMSYFLIGFLIPCIVIVVCYARIFCVVRKSDLRVRGHSQKGAKGSRSISTGGSDWRLTKMILAVFLSFVFCYLPATVVKVADRRSNYPNMHLIAYVFIYLSACINPVIYVTMNRQYRRAYNNLFCAATTSGQPPTNSTTVAGSLKRHGKVEEERDSVMRMELVSRLANRNSKF